MMRMGRLGAIIGTSAWLSLAASAAAPQEGPRIVTEDVERFYRVYDSAGGRPAAPDLQRLYVDVGSAGLRDFAKLRQISGESLVTAIREDPAMFEAARRCVAVLPKVNTRLVTTLDKLRTIYPSATLAPITITIGRGNSGGTTSPAGVLIGLEKLCAANYMEANVEDRFVHLIAHEYAHIQQPATYPGAQSQAPTVLFASLLEGGAEFLGELISGRVSYPHLQEWTKGRETEIERRFVADRDKTDLSEWLYNGAGTVADPGDLGYWAGYRVVKAYYARAQDKPKALRDILTVTSQTAGQILDNSGVGQ